MFEKEAEEYADKDFGMYEPTDHERYAKETDWRNGAEFGYNKAMNEAKEIIKKLYSHIFQGMGFMEINDYNVQKAEAEQFLNSEVEE